MAIVVVLGPTAAGKSSLALRLAEAVQPQGEIINADSMAVYRGMDVGTAKPTLAERRGVVHHLIDVWPIDQVANVALFQQLARSAIGQCQQRGVLPIVVGGSALYLRAVTDVLDFPATDPAVRARWEAVLDEQGSEAVYAELVRRDPDAASRIERRNGRRVVRALEVIELTGRPYAAALPTPRYALPGVVQLGLDAPRAWIDERIERRVDQMWADGFVEEVRVLAAAGLADTVTAARAIGYRQVLGFLAGELTEDQARAETVIQTRRFVRRQLAWWRRDDRIIWLDATLPPEELMAAARTAVIGSR